MCSTLPPSSVEVNKKKFDYIEDSISESFPVSFKKADMDGTYPSNVEHKIDSALSDNEEQVEFKDESIDNYIREAKDDASELSDMRDPTKSHPKETRPLLAVNAVIEGTIPPAMPSMKLMKTGVRSLLINVFLPELHQLTKKLKQMVTMLLRRSRLGVARHHIRSRGQDCCCVVIFVQATHCIRNKLAFVSVIHDDIFDCVCNIILNAWYYSQSKSVVTILRGW